ncbi:MAG: 16S rRNA processing protein RimM [Thiomicrorhabdus sp.]|nr:MAG: 16S rRNA processing protein RimM [Thiomicrorhabdus sp.]
MSDEKLIVGQINGIFGVNGWVKIFSHTDPRKNILSYSPWLIKFNGEWREIAVIDSKVQSGGKTLVAQLENVTDRDVAREYMGCEIAIDRSLLKSSDDGWFWIDLVGCQVITQDNVVLGEVKEMIVTGAHDVLRIQGESEVLIPFVMERFIQSVDIKKKQIVVDWELEEEEDTSEV